MMAELPQVRGMKVFVVFRKNTETQLLSLQESALILEMIDLGEPHLSQNWDVCKQRPFDTTAFYLSYSVSTDKCLVLWALVTVLTSHQLKARALNRSY